MWKRTLHLAVTILLLLGILALRVNIQLARAEPGIIVVPDKYARIKWAIGNATAGTTIFVRNATYYEQLDVNKPLTLVGENRDSTIIDGNKTGTVIKVTANDVVIRGFTIRNSNQSAVTSHAGIKISGQRCNITGNHITKNKIGIFVTSQKSRIEENRVINNGQGIALYDSSEVMVEANDVSANSVGISLAFSSNNIIVGNKAVNSSLGGHGMTLLSKSFNNTIENNEFTGNFHGMWLSSSFSNWIANNTIANNELLGIELASSSSNTFSHNNIINNPTPVRVDTQTPNKSVCIWDDGYDSGGNYWHDYTDVDERSGPNQDQPGSDEIWDNPYVIDENNKDRYPSVKPYGDISSIIPCEENLTAKAGADKTVKIGSTVTFDASGSTGNILSCEWDFGDGVTKTGVICNHTYCETETYYVTLTIRDAEGNLSTDQLTVTVIADDASPPGDAPLPWISALAGVIVIVLAATLFWKHKLSKRARRKKIRKVRAINRIRVGIYSISQTVIFVLQKYALNRFFSLTIIG